MPEISDSTTDAMRPLRMSVRIGTACALIVLVQSVVVVAGWMFDVEILRGSLFGSVAVRPNGAVVLLCCSLALYLDRDPKRRAIVVVLSLFALMIGVATLAEYMSPFHIAIDDLLVTRFTAERMAEHGARMSPLAAAASALSAIALLIKSGAVSTLASSGVGFLGLLSALAFIFRARLVLEIAPYAPISFISAILFSILAVGLLARSDGPLMTTMFAQDRWGRTLRRVTIASFLVPLLLGALCVISVNAGVFDRRFALVLVLIMSGIAMTLTVAWFAIRLRADDHRREIDDANARQSLEKACETLRAQVVDLEGSDSEVSPETFAELMQARSEMDLYRIRLEDLASRLASANAEMAAFSYSVSHDLRAPLRSIDGFTRELQLGYADKLDEQGQHYLRRVQMATRRMSQLIDDMLNLARLSRKPMRREPVDFSELAGLIATEQRERAASRVIQFHIEPGIAVSADPALMRIALENLIGNAVKFTATQPVANIEIGRSDDAFFIRDNGVGFNPAHAERLFAPFQRLHSGAEFDGTGIGLAIVQRIVHRHGGKVRAESAPDQGATFHFTLGRPADGGN